MEARLQTEEFAFGHCLESGGRFFISVFGRNLASVAMRMFSHVIKLKIINFTLSGIFVNIILQ
jgi:hypothetical protein